MKDMTIRTVLLVLVSTFVSLGASRSADAQTLWSSNGASCVVASGSSAYTVTAGTVATAGVVTLYCPISYSTGFDGVDLMTLEVDHKGLKQNTLIKHAYVQANVVAMSRITGAETTLASYTPNGSSSYVSDVTNFSPTPFDFDSNFYYMRVVLVVTTTDVGYDQTLYGVALSVGIP